MGDENSNQPRTIGDYSRPSHEGYQNAIELLEGAKFFPPERTAKLRNDDVLTTSSLIRRREDDPTFSEKGSPDYIDATLEQELESMECRLESLTKNEVLLEYEIGFTFPKRTYQEEL
ncbi:hypothetical protein Tco_0154754 [Tanacetum coccineum]